MTIIQLLVPLASKSIFDKRLKGLCGRKKLYGPTYDKKVAIRQLDLTFFLEFNNLTSFRQIKITDAITILFPGF